MEQVTLLRRALGFLPPAKYTATSL